ncbi:MAG: hypothetical protein MI922_05070, partial [Bacteroidales bacterium]|nr:hypothetical protein [Bacteroidales bacterium]
ASTELTHKFSARHTIKGGMSGSVVAFRFNVDEFQYAYNRMDKLLKDNGSSELANAYVNWKYRPVKKLTFNSGIHVNYLNLGKKYAVEPRMAVRWNISPRQTISAGFGLHSKSENISVYLAKETDSLGITHQHNRELEMSKARHYILGYEYRFTRNLNFKIEAYYQELYNVPIGVGSQTSYSLLNEDNGYVNRQLINDGAGENIGAEITLEKFFADNYYFMITGSVFDSKYKGSDGVTRNTKFNNNYIGNVLFGKEWLVGKAGKSAIGLNVRATHAGGQWKTPVDLEESRKHQWTRRDETKAFTERYPDYFRADLKLSYRINTKNATNVIEIDIQNVSNTLNVTGEYYSSTEDRVVEYTQLGMLPTLNYRIEF